MSERVYEIVTERIIQALEAGAAPWRRPWSGQGPRNAISGHEYRGINVFLLHCLGFSDPRFLTFNQCKAKGSMVRKSEHACPVIFWSLLKREKAGKTETFPILRYYNVFNVAQCDNLTLPALEGFTAEREPITEAEAIVAGMPNVPAIHEAVSDRACYRPTEDVVSMPSRGQFPDLAAFYSTLFHELTHSTGHASRLGRDLGNRFGSGPYGREELVAEMGAAFLAGSCGLTLAEPEAPVSYLAAWLKTIREDAKAVVVAAGAAQKAADYILGRQAAVETESEVAA